MLRYKGLSVHKCCLSTVGVPAMQGVKVKALAEFLEAPKRLSARDQAELVRNALQSSTASSPMGACLLH